MDAGLDQILSVSMLFRLQKPQPIRIDYNQKLQNMIFMSLDMVS